MPGLGEGFQLAEDRQRVLADPTMAGDDMVGGMTERFHTGGVDLDDGEGGGITAGVAEAEIGGVERVEFGFVHTGDVDGGGFPHPQPLPLRGRALADGGAKAEGEGGGRHIFHH